MKLINCLVWLFGSKQQIAKMQFGKRLTKEEQARRADLAKAKALFPAVAEWLTACRFDLETYEYFPNWICLEKLNDFKALKHFVNLWPRDANGVKVSYAKWPIDTPDNKVYVHFTEAHLALYGEKCKLVTNAENTVPKG